MKERIVIKCGGSVLQKLSSSFFKSLAILQARYEIVIVHGGGPEIDEMLDTLHIQTKKKQGLRITTKEVLDVAAMVLCGKINKDLVIRLQQEGMNAVGISGCDAKILEAEMMNYEELGYVGEVKKVNIHVLECLLSHNMIPVISPIGVDEQCQMYNINADTAAGAIASELNAAHVLFVTDVPGILCEGSVLHTAEKKLLLELMENGTITGGMIPKVQAALASLQGNVESVVIVDGTASLIGSGEKIRGTTIKKEVVIG
ncbi:acetylglutamate kinase [Bacillus sp. 165]|uniref:acetylglutamate kinase n=1 Tax=Bacillus sp. 165 TaxID=1529117 RepID=UPI001ADA5191|nr:acetylglutamate kinase [Bacillus sp. 165]MBO9129762.1 acetylglutamate kinase [Bacillus sp. 165]